MTAMILIPAIAAVVIIGAGFLTLLVMPLIGMRTEGSRMRQSSAPNTRTGTAARLILGVYVRDQSQEISVRYDARGGSPCALCRPDSLKIAAHAAHFSKTE